MSIRIGDKSIKAIKIGNNDVKKIMLGSTQVWPVEKSNKIEYQHSFIKSTGDWNHNSPVIFTIPETGNYKFDFTFTVVATTACSEHPLFEFFPNFVDGQPNNGISISPWNTTTFSRNEEKIFQQTKTFYAVKGQQYTITMKTQDDSYKDVIIFNFLATWERV